MAIDQRNNRSIGRHHHLSSQIYDETDGEPVTEALTPEVQAALEAATSPSGSNAFATASVVTAAIDALATVATTGAYADVTGTPSLATVATTGSYNDLSDKPTIPSTITGTLVFAFDGGGSAVAQNTKVDLRVPFAGTITKASVMADQTGAVTIGVWSAALADVPLNSADSIAASAKPTLSAAAYIEDATLTGWTTAFSAGATFTANLDTVDSTLTRVTLMLDYTRNI